MFNKIQLIILVFVCFLILSSCQKTEFLDDAVFDNSLLHNISFNAEEKNLTLPMKQQLVNLILIMLWKYHLQ